MHQPLLPIVASNSSSLANRFRFYFFFFAFFFTFYPADLLRKEADSQTSRQGADDIKVTATAAAAPVIS